jgi:alkylation response protein AidB-like acyl-CoA dehydrogenase
MDGASPVTTSPVYSVPLRDIQFVLTELADLDAVAALPGCEEASREVATAILEEAARFAESVLAPLNRSGDVQGARLQGEEVSTPAGWRRAYSAFTEAGWSSLTGPKEYGGQGLPRILAAPVKEMWKSANLAFSLCPMLTEGAIEALARCGSEELKRAFLPPMVRGEWSGTMNLTEPHAGSDLGAVRTRAVPQSDGSYRLFGQKIFITYGDHDLTDNIVHLVLARTPEAPEGVRGISLFVVPKFLINANGGRTRNDVRCVALEHKLGIHASPTATLAYGDASGAVGYLVGEEHRGLEYMFVMMGEARFAVGIEGIAIGERAYQQARAYARERRQGRDALDGAQHVPIIRHGDVRRMLLTMKARTEAARALAYCVAAAADFAHHHPDPEERRASQGFVELLIPVVKGWSTELGIETASLGVQIHGGVGFVEETGAAQHLRDARITTIYEGTTGIQAIDLIGRKIVRDGGVAVRALIERIGALDRELAEAVGSDDLMILRRRLALGLRSLTASVDWILDNARGNLPAVLAGAVPFLNLLGTVCGGWQMARAALVAQRRLAAGDADAEFLRGKLLTARFYADHVLSLAPAYADATINGAAGTLGMAEEQF